jgi:hypothetical protein
MGSHRSHWLLAVLVVGCTGWGAVPSAEGQESLPDYRRAGYGARGVGTADWLFVPPMQSVFNRSRPDYDPTGLRLGSFLLYPELGVTGAYDSNVFADEHDTTADFFGAVSPAFRVQSDWSNHLLGAEGAAELTGYADETDQNSVEGRGSIYGRLDITSDDALYGSAAYRRVVEPPGNDPDEVANDENDKTEFDRWIGRVGYAHQFARMNLRVDAQGQRYNYLDAADQDKDRDELDLGARLIYALSPRFTPFVEIDYTMQNFDDAVDDTGIDRDQQKYSAQVGGRILITELLLAELSGGVSYINFEDSSLDSVAAPVANGELTWNITPLTSIIGLASIEQQPTTQAGASSKLRSSVGARVEHELLSNLLVFGEAGYRNDTFQDSNRTDNRIRAGIGGEFLVNAYLSFNARYQFEYRESNVVEDFTRNLVLIGARVQY